MAAMEGELFRPHCDSSARAPEHGFDLTYRGPKAMPY